jgi:hypothetical protein
MNCWEANWVETNEFHWEVGYLGFRDCQFKVQSKESMIGS